MCSKNTQTLLKNKAEGKQKRRRRVISESLEAGARYETGSKVIRRAGHSSTRVVERS